MGNYATKNYIYYTNYYSFSVLFTNNEILACFLGVITALDFICRLHLVDFEFKN